ncbi:unnamed protein product [Camellia sinensis]
MSSTTSPEKDIAAGVPGSLAEERNVLGERGFDPVDDRTRPVRGIWIREENLSPHTPEYAVETDSFVVPSLPTNLRELTVGLLSHCFFRGGKGNFSGFERNSLTEVRTGRLTLTCEGSDKFKVFPFTDISQARIEDLCNLIYS